MAEAIPDDVTGQSLLDLVSGLAASHDPELYLTEATWMRKHGWRTPDWKLIVALEPDFHFKPEVELYDLRADPAEEVNLAHARPEVVSDLRGRMDVHIAERTKATGRPAPIETVLDWHGKAGRGAFTTSQEAYDTLHIGDPEAGRRLQAGSVGRSPRKRASAEPKSRRSASTAGARKPSASAPITKAKTSSTTSGRTAAKPSAKTTAHKSPARMTTGHKTTLRGSKTRGGAGP